MREWPIKSWWYTRKKGLTIEETIDKDPDWMLWAIKSFQNITPEQARYLYKKTGKRVNPKYIQDVPVYVWEPGDTDSLYMDICATQDLEGSIIKHRGKQLELF